MKTHHHSQRAGYLVLASLFLLQACSKAQFTEQAQPSPEQAGLSTVESDPLLKSARMVFQPLPPGPAAAGPLVDLGRLLYYDPRLSKSGTISCNSCHSLQDYGTDRKSTSAGDKGKLGQRNSPTVYNAGLHFAQFWDGRAHTLEEQAAGPMLNPVEMAMAGEDQIVATLQQVAEYRQRFALSFPGQKQPITLANTATAIAAFEKGLLTPSPFDRYLEGDSKALTEPQKTGLNTFLQVGCASCHSGVALGGNSYQKLGLKRPYPSQDTGRFQVTNQPADRFVFKVPSLRNITETGPYFHNGKVKSLDEAIQLMAQHQLDRKLSPSQIDDLKEFLGALKGTIPADYIRPPVLPPNQTL